MFGTHNTLCVYKYVIQNSRCLASRIASAPTAHGMCGACPGKHLSSLTWVAVLRIVLVAATVAVAAAVATVAIVAAVVVS